MTEHRRPSGSRAVVVGGSLAGMTAAAALAEHADEVVVVERDALPEGPVPRRGLPQARHVHLLMSGGGQAVERLFPGLTGRLLAAGARELPMPADMVLYSPYGWFRRWAGTHGILLCSRDLLDWAVRREVARNPRIVVRDRTEALGPTGDAGRVTGVRLRGAGAAGASTGEGGAAGVEWLGADLVVDAGGRGSRAPVWLTELGAEAPAETTVDPGLVYASRLYRAPEGAERFPVVSVQGDPHGGVPGRGTVLEPVEDGRWLVTLYGTRGGEPTGDPSHFVDFARGARHPIVGDLIAQSEPLSDVVLTRTTVNRRRHFERLSVWPDGLVAVGDAVAAYNPVYGHGMTVAAQEAVVLGEVVRSRGLAAPGTARRAQRAVAGPAAAAWDLAVGQDVFYPGVRGSTPSLLERLSARYVARAMYASTGSERIARALNEVMMLEKRPTTLLRPRIAVAALRGPRRPSLAGPPLTAAEFAVAGLTPDRDRAEGRPGGGCDLVRDRDPDPDPDPVS